MKTCRIFGKCKFQFTIVFWIRMYVRSLWPLGSHKGLYRHRLWMAHGSCLIAKSAPGPRPLGNGNGLQRLEGLAQIGWAARPSPHKCLQALWTMWEWPKQNWRPRRNSWQIGVGGICQSTLYDNLKNGRGHKLRPYVLFPEKSVL